MSSELEDVKTVIKALKVDFEHFQRDLERYEAGDLDYPFQIIRFDLDELYDSVSELLKYVD